MGFHRLERRIGLPDFHDFEGGGVAGGDLVAGEGQVFAEQVFGDGEIGIGIDAGEGREFAGSSSGIEQVAADELLLGGIAEVGAGEQVGDHFATGLD